MAGDGAGRLVRALRRNERTISRLYLVAVASLLALWLWPATRDLVSHQVRRYSLRVESGWRAELARAQELLAAGHLERAERDFERLARDLPATHLKHALSLERGQVLEGLTRAYWARGRKRRSLEAVRILAAYEPRNYGYHVLHGAVAEAFGEGEEALLAWGRALAIHPNHLPTVSHVVAAHAERGDAEAVVDAYEAYLDAFATAPVFVGEERILEGLPVDARWHGFEVKLAGSPPSALDPEVRGALSEVERLESISPLRAGGSSMDGASASRLRGRLRAFKPVDAELWQMVERACRNLLAWERLAALEERTRVMPGDEEPGEGLGRDEELAS